MSCRLRLPLFCLLSFAMVLTGCRKAAKPAAATPTRSFSVQGVIVQPNVTPGEVLLSHEAIPGFMEAMTMPYKLKDPGVMSELHPGDHIMAQLLVDEYSDGSFHNPRLDQIVVTAQARPDYRPPVQYHVPQAGDAVPDFRVTSQSGKSVHFDQFHGKLLLITFIYTRCPIADFCPRMNKNFAQIDKALVADPNLYKQTQMLSISFDPGYDTPATLREFSPNYIPEDQRKSDHWEFAVPSAAELTKMEKFFDLGVTTGENGTFNHSLSTVLIDKTGKVVDFEHTNEWTPQQMLEKIRAAAGA
jgi:protein SCO1/2